MPTRPRKPTDLPEPERPGRDEEDPIEILEVVGVDETTGAVKKKTEREERPSARPGGRARAETSDLTRELEETKRDKDKYYDLLLRKQADFDNFRKRMERERDESVAVAVRDVLKRLLPILDNMERALRASEGSKDPLFKGIELVHQQFLDLLRKEGVVQIDALGARFDPRLHEAVEVRDVPGFEPTSFSRRCRRAIPTTKGCCGPALVRVTAGSGAERAPSSGPQRDDEDAGRSHEPGNGYRPGNDELLRRGHGRRNTPGDPEQGRGPHHPPPSSPSRRRGSGWWGRSPSASRSPIPTTRSTP